MKSGRAYHMTARAQAAADTGRRILDAMRALFEELPYERITLQSVAGRAGVTLQTVLRRFGSKDGLLSAAAALGMEEIAAQRGEASAGDVAGAIANLFDHYEAWGRVSLRMLEQEERIPQIGELTRGARQFHAQWVDRVFVDALRGRRGQAREMLRSQLVAVTDVYMWKLLRLDQGLNRAQAERAVKGIVEALGGAGGGA